MCSARHHLAIARSTVLKKGVTVTPLGVLVVMFIFDTLGCKLVLTPHLAALINNFSCYPHPLIYKDSVLQSQDHELERDRGGCMLTDSGSQVIHHVMFILWYL